MEKKKKKADIPKIALRELLLYGEKRDEMVCEVETRLSEDNVFMLQQSAEGFHPEALAERFAKHLNEAAVKVCVCFFIGRTLISIRPPQTPHPPPPPLT